MNLCKMPLYYRHLWKWEFCLQPSNTWITSNYLKQFKQFNFAQGSHFRINEIAKITFWAMYFLPQDFRPCIFQPTPDVVLIFSYTLFYFCFALACSFTIAVPLVFYGTLGYPNHFLDQLGLQIPENVLSTQMLAWM